VKRRDARRRASRRRGSVEPAAFRSVIAAVDLTPASDRVLRRLALLPIAEDASVMLVHVVPKGLPRAEQRGAVRDADAALAEEERHLRKALPRSVRVGRLVRLGGAAKEIGACAARAKAELIVVGRGGASALREAFLGSTAERVIRKARLPVLAVGPSPRAAHWRPVVALDLDRAAIAVIRFVLRLFPPPRPPIPVVHAFGVPYSTLVYDSLSDAEIVEMQDVFRRRAGRELTERLDAAVPRTVTAPSWRVSVRYGSPRVVVRNVVRSAGADLLVLGTRGYSGAAHAFVGSIAGDLLRKAKCDVVVVPPEPRR